MATNGHLLCVLGGLSAEDGEDTVHLSGDVLAQMKRSSPGEVYIMKDQNTSKSGTELRYVVSNRNTTLLVTDNSDGQFPRAQIIANIFQDPANNNDLINLAVKQLELILKIAKGCGVKDIRIRVDKAYDRNILKITSCQEKENFTVYLATLERE